jgi:dihydrofolate reductase
MELGFDGAFGHFNASSGDRSRVMAPGMRSGTNRNRNDHPWWQKCLTEGDTMAKPDSCVTIHMAASLDGFIARKDGSVDWLETSDEFVHGDTMDPEFVRAVLQTIDCYVMGSRTYETALRFEAQGLGWAYGDKPTFVLTNRALPRTRDNVEFCSGDLTQFVNGRLRPTFRTIWFVGGSVVSAECLRRELADEVRYSILPILIGDGISFFGKLDREIPLHLAEVKAYKSGMVELRYEVRGVA